MDDVVVLVGTVVSVHDGLVLLPPKAIYPICVATALFNPHTKLIVPPLKVTGA